MAARPRARCHASRRRLCSPRRSPACPLGAGQGSKAKRDKAERQAFKAELRQDTDRLGRCAAEVVAVALEKGWPGPDVGRAWPCDALELVAAASCRPEARQGGMARHRDRSRAASDPGRSGTSRDLRRPSDLLLPTRSSATAPPGNVTASQPCELSCPTSDLYDPAGRYSTDAGWLRAWPRVLPTLSGLVVFGTRDGVVGVGCLREIADARRAGLPVAVLDHRCRARTYAGLALPARAPTSRRAAVLVPGEPVNLRELFGIDEGAA